MIETVRRTNCVNCGAAIDWDVKRCPFCGTQYIDFSEVEFNKPTAIRFKMNGWHTNVDTITMLALPRLESIEQDSPEITLYADNRRVYTACEPQPPVFNVTFTPIMDENGHFMRFTTITEAPNAGKEG